MIMYMNYLETIFSICLSLFTHDVKDCRQINRQVVFNEQSMGLSRNELKHCLYKLAVSKKNVNNQK